MTSPLGETQFTLGPWRVDPAANEVRRGGEVVRLEPKATAVLVHLAANAGRVVTREELLDAVWPDVVVTDASLTRCVSQLRQALGDDPRAPRLIETIPKVGYRLLTSPAAASSPPGPPPPAAGPTQEPPPRRRWAIGLAVAALAAVLWAMARTLTGPPASVVVEYRIEVVGEVEDAVVTYTGARDEPGVDAAASFPFAETVVVGDRRDGVYRIRVRGRSTGAEVSVSVVARRAGAVLTQSQTTWTIEEGPLQPFDLNALAQFSDE